MHPRQAPGRHLLYLGHRQISLARLYRRDRKSHFDLRLALTNLLRPTVMQTGVSALLAMRPGSTLHPSLTAQTQSDLSWLQRSNSGGEQ